MPVHDWTRVDAGIFHDFHGAWITELRNALNGGLLPPDYYALSEQHAGRPIADVLTLQARPPGDLPPASRPAAGVAIAEPLPRVGRRHVLARTLHGRRRTLAIRHASGHRIVAIIEIVSPANKDRPRNVTESVWKLASALELGVHVLLIDLFPPGPHDPRGLHAALSEELGADPAETPLPSPGARIVATYLADGEVEADVGHLAIGAPLPQTPLFLDPDLHVNVPLEPTYQAAYRGVPAFWRDMLEGRPPQPD